VAKKRAPRRKERSSTPATRKAAVLAPPAAISQPLPPGKAGNEVPIATAAFQQMISAAATKGNSGTQVWVQGASELLVSTGKVTAALDNGLILISVPVVCDQVPAATIQVAFATGSKDAPAGMICATEERPRGPAAIVDAWGDAIIAYAWRVLLTAVTAAAAKSGTDLDGAGLIAASITSAKDGIVLLPIARHTFDRVQL
jgi:hypothetical protein